MNILFLTIVELKDIKEHTVYCDLLRCFRDNGHEIYTISPYERKTGKKTEYRHDKRVHMLSVSTGNITKCGLVEKGISTIFIEYIFMRGVKKYFKSVKFDLVIYSTPPITFYKTIRYVKKRDGAKSYLLLKDIFPQNAVDIGMITTVGVKGLIYKFFRAKEKKLYAISDHIGCMSQANAEYVIRHNPEVNPEIVEVCPNSIEVIDKSIEEGNRINIRKKYNIPLDKTIFVYGGNLGKPQGIGFLIKCLYKQRSNRKVFFLIVGDGTEYSKLEQFVIEHPQENMKLMRKLPKEDFDEVVAACDVGMIFLDNRFTIPNFPSRLLSYMQAGIPVLACTDVSTDIGKIVVEGGFGWWCRSDNVEGFQRTVNCILEEGKEKFNDMKNKEWEFLSEQYSCDLSYKIIMKGLRG